MKPLKHQEKFQKGYKGSRLIVHEGGTGKTVCACLWLRDGRDSDALVVCPKKVIKKWQKALREWGTKAEVVSKETFKKMDHRKRSAIVIDEADEFAAPLFVGKKRSALATTLYEYVREFEPDILLLTATPIRSNPWNLHTLLCYIGEYIEWKTWRNEFFDLKYPEEHGRYSYLTRPSYIARPDWRKKIRPYLEQYADIVLLRDCVKELPPEIQETIEVKTPPFVMTEDTKPFFDEHKWEQQNKPKEILEIGKEFRKVLVVAYYREQIEELEKILKKDKETFSVHGGVKDQEGVLEQAAQSDECYLIVQASVGAGFDGDSFSCIVFASMSYAVRDFVQMKFRVRRIHNLHPVKHYFLVGGRCDEGVIKNVQMGRDFVPSEWNPKLL